MIEFDCPKCLQQINARDQQPGQSIDCPGCSVTLLVPSPAVGPLDDLFGSSNITDNADHKIDGRDEQSVPFFDSPADRPIAEDNPPTISNQRIDESTDDRRAEQVRSFAAESESILGGNNLNNSSAVFENLHFPDTQDQPRASDIVPSHQPLDATMNLNQEQASFKVNHDERLEIDGGTDVLSAPETCALKCPVCGSHLFVATHAVGTKVKCADCFSKITVPKPTEKQIESSAKQESNFSQTLPHQTSNEQLTSAIEVDPSFGLAPDSRDLLAPIAGTGKTESGAFAASDGLRLQPITDLPIDALPQTLPAKGPTSSRHSAEELKQPWIPTYRPQSVQVAKQKKRSNRQKNSGRSETLSEFPEFEFDSLLSAMTNLVTQTGVVVRCIAAAILLATGNVVSHVAVADYVAIDAPTLGDTAVMAFWRIGVGWALFGLGTLFLWYCAGVVFRKTATGVQQIETWQIGPSSEWTSTFLMIAFSFAVAGAPLMMFGATWLSAPLRFVLALPMLVSVWHTQSPFHIICVDAFGNYHRRRSQWKSVGLAVFVLAGLAFFSGLLMAIALSYLNIITSAFGAIVLSFATLGYAAVTGWHSGKMVEELN